MYCVPRIPKRISAVTRALFKLADAGNKQHIKGDFFASFL